MRRAIARRVVARHPHERLQELDLARPVGSNDVLKGNHRVGQRRAGAAGLLPRAAGRGTAEGGGGPGSRASPSSCLSPYPTLGPLHHASHGPPPPLRGGGIAPQPDPRIGCRAGPSLSEATRRRRSSRSQMALLPPFIPPCEDLLYGYRLRPLADFRYFGQGSLCLTIVAGRGGGRDACDSSSLAANQNGFSLLDLLEERSKIPRRFSSGNLAHRNYPKNGRLAL